MKSKMTMAVAAYAFAFLASTAFPHCEIPCGIFDDRMRINHIAEHITTIEKSMNEINRLAKESDKNYNQLVRWINNKELHAKQLQEIVFQYFMNQRVAPVDEDNTADYRNYVAQITLLHKMLVGSMKCTQTTDLKHIADLRELLALFETSYFGNQGTDDHGHDHGHQH